MSPPSSDSRTPGASSAPADPRRHEPTYLAKSQGGVGFPQGRTALLVIDPVNDLLSEGGAAWDMTRSTVTLHDVVGHLRQAIAGARQHGVPVLFGPMAYTEEDYVDGKLQCRCGINRIMFEKRMFLAGSWGADFHPDLRPREDEIVLLPHKGTDVFETDLPTHLERLGITHLVIAGMAANLCCESTGRHAVEKGYDVTYLSNAIGAETLAAYEAAIHVNYPMVANAVMTVDEFLVAMDSLSGVNVEVEPDDVVRGSDRGEIGTVMRVTAPTDETEGYMLVSRGLLSDDVCIPLDAIVNRAGNEVFVNVPRVVVGKMPWDRPPERRQQREKYGPAAAEVDMLYGSLAPSIVDGGDRAE
jgi:ureidoacrylate peracid hydrolase